MHQVKETLDCRDLYCPMPIVKMKKALKGMAEGEAVRILATDSGSKRDFEAFCRKTGHKLLESLEEDGGFAYVVEKGGS